MRAREFLLEYRHDITMQNFGEKFRDRMLGDMTITASTQNKLEDAKEKGIGPASDEITPGYLRRIEQSDPTANKEYTQWMVRAYINGIARYYEDVLSQLVEFVTWFDKLKRHRRLPAEYRDINQIKDRTTYNKAWRAVADTYDEFVETQPLSKGDAEEIFNGPEVRIIRPYDQDAACYYGQGTRWCTAAKQSNNYFKDYNDDGPLLILLPKNPQYDGEKYQVHGASGQVMNEQDEPVELFALLARFPKTNLRDILSDADEAWEDYVETMDPDDLKHIISLYNSRLIRFNKWILDQYLKNDMLSDEQKKEAQAAASRVDWARLGQFTYDQFEEYAKTAPLKTKEYITHSFADLSYRLMYNTLYEADAFVTFDNSPRNSLRSALVPYSDSVRNGLTKRKLLENWRLLISDWRVKYEEGWPVYVGPTMNSIYNNAVGFDSQS
jgi:hypothetical protein